MGRNLGATSLRRRAQGRCPMQAYDDLPAPLREWLSQAVLPWSAKSAKRIWARARAKGQSEAEVLRALAQAEIKTLERERAV